MPGMRISVAKLKLTVFKLDSPYGTCPECNGLDSKCDFNTAKVIVDWSKPLFEGGLGPGSGSVPCGARFGLRHKPMGSIWVRP